MFSLRVTPLNKMLVIVHFKTSTRVSTTKKTITTTNSPRRINKIKKRCGNP
jgi:hypothetical protein